MKKISAVMIMTLLIPLTSIADEYALGLKAGTLGVGIEGTMGVNEDFNLRLQANGMGLDGNVSHAGIAYKNEMTFATAGIIADWYPLEGSLSGFRVSGGAYYNMNKLHLSTSPAGAINIGGTNYSAAQAGTVNADLKYNKFSPYLGIGYGNPFGKDSSFSFNVDLGVLYQGKPTATMTASGGGVTAADLRTEEAQLIHAVDARWWPVAAVGIAYRF